MGQGGSGGSDVCVLIIRTMLGGVGFWYGRFRHVW
jgi:hypothetical protein